MKIFWRLQDNTRPLLFDPGSSSKGQTWLKSGTVCLNHHGKRWKTWLRLSPNFGEDGRKAYVFLQVQQSLSQSTYKRSLAEIWAIWCEVLICRMVISHLWIPFSWLYFWNPNLRYDSYWWVRGFYQEFIRCTYLRIILNRTCDDDPTWT